MSRRLIAILAGLLATLAIGGTAVAGGWASIVPDDEGVAPVAGEPTEIGFTVMQHGVTPVSWVSPTVVVRTDYRDPGTHFAATQSGATGHFVALVTLSEPGDYQWSVQMPDLAVESEAIPFTVTGTAVAPTPAGPTAAETALTAQVTALQSQVTSLQAEITTLRVLVIALAAGLVAFIAAALVLAWERRRHVSTMATARR